MGRKGGKEEAKDTLEIAWRGGYPRGREEGKSRGGDIGVEDGMMLLLWL